MRFEKKITILISIIAILCLFRISTGSASQAEIAWVSYDDAISRVDKEPKKILISFYSERCEYCKVMDEETFRDSAIVAYINKNFIPVRVNSDKEQNTASIFKVRGLPDTWFLSETKENIGHWPGFIPAKTLIMVLKYINTDSYKGMSFKNFVDTQ